MTPVNKKCSVSIPIMGIAKLLPLIADEAS